MTGRRRDTRKTRKRSQDEKRGAFRQTDRSVYGPFRRRNRKTILAQKEACMDKKTVLLLAAYQQAADAKMDEVIKTLTPEEWDRDLGGFFKSIHAMCSHLYVSDFNLLKGRYFKVREFKLAGDNFFAPEYSFRDVLFPAKEEYLAARPELDKKIAAFSEQLTEADFSLVMKYTDYKGNPKEKEFGGAILHGFNHATHHRGMVSVYLEILGKANDFNSLMAHVEKKG
jgi:uncharacterized damage-inducible protein DinB